MSLATGDRQLVDRIAAGDDEALDRLYRIHGDAVYGLALTSLRDPALAEDVVQEVFVGLWQRPDRFDETRGSLRSLLCTMAHHRAVDLLRSRTASQRREEADAVEGSTRTASGVDEATVDRALAEVVRDAVHQLPDDQREAVLLAYFGDRSYRQVAVELGIPEGTAKSRLRAGLASLGRLLEQRGALSWT